MAPASQHPLYLGLMSGTSRDGIDAALLCTDGKTAIAPGAWRSEPYDAPFRERLAEAAQRARHEGLSAHAALAELEAEFTDRHAEAARRLLAEAGIDRRAVAAVGFHGHTLLHRPEEGLTWQIGDPERLARALGVSVVGALRAADIAAGGQGAPIAPVYHRARLLRSSAPARAVVLNIGGVANVTWVDRTGYCEPDLLAFDCGPGNALIDDWVMAETGRAYDEGGTLASAGEVHEEIVAQLMDHPFFSRPPPKSLDRDAFPSDAVLGLNAADGAATLTAFTAEAAAAAEVHFPAPPEAWYVAGGGRHNRTLMEMLAERLRAPVTPVEALGWRGDALEAELVAYLAARRLAGLPATYPSTTGVAAPTVAGQLFAP